MRDSGLGFEALRTAAEGLMLIWRHATTPGCWRVVAWRVARASTTESGRAKPSDSRWAVICKLTHSPGSSHSSRKSARSPPATLQRDIAVACYDSGKKLWLQDDAGTVGATLTFVPICSATATSPSSMCINGESMTDSEPSLNTVTSAFPHAAQLVGMVSAPNEALRARRPASIAVPERQSWGVDRWQAPSSTFAMRSWSRLSQRQTFRLCL